MLSGCRRACPGRSTRNAGAPDRRPESVDEEAGKRFSAPGRRQEDLGARNGKRLAGGENGEVGPIRGLAAGSGCTVKRGRRAQLQRRHRRTTDLPRPPDSGTSRRRTVDARACRSALALRRPERGGCRRRGQLWACRGRGRGRFGWRWASCWRELLAGAVLELRGAAGPGTVTATSWARAVFSTLLVARCRRKTRSPERRAIGATHALVAQAQCVCVHRSACTSSPRSLASLVVVRSAASARRLLRAWRRLC